MDPVDYRTASWQDLQGKLQGLRLQVLSAWRQHGPGTTAEIAHKSGISILTLRPRTTELYQLGFITLIDASAHRGHEGEYRALSDGEAWDIFRKQKTAATDPQLTMSL